MHPKERGISRLPPPTSKEYVAYEYPKDPGSVFLFTLENWMLHGAVGLRINHDGTISEHGIKTRWTVADLKFTGRVADEPSNYP